MPDFSKDSYQVALSKLKGLGSVIGEGFNQVSFRTELAVKPTNDGKFEYYSSIGDKTLGNGYCSGVCLDWIRRVLLSKPEKSNDAGYLTYHSGALKSEKGDIKHSHEELRDRAFQTSGRMAHAWDRRNEMPWTGPMNQTSKVVKDGQWNETASALDKSFSQLRTKADRKPSKKSFSQLKLEGSKMDTYNSGQWYTALVNAFQPGCCALVGFDKSNVSGHALAIWQRRIETDNPDSFYLFDPNFGVFSYARGKLKSVLVYLFFTNKECTPYYKACADEPQRMTYQIFGPVNLVGAVPQAVPLPKPLSQGVGSPPLTVQSSPNPSTAKKVNQLISIFESKR